MNKHRLLFILLWSGSMLQAANSDTSFLFLIPQPKKVEFKRGTFNLSNSYSVRTIHADTFYQQLLKAGMDTKFNTPVSGGRTPVNEIKLIKADSLELYRFVLHEKSNLPFTLGAEGYVLSISLGSIVIIASENAGVFYGVQTLLQLVHANSKENSIPCMLIYDKPDMQIRGWQDDISRGPIPTLDFLKEQIKKMASFKLNTLTLYTEHVFKLRQYPDIAPADGITAEEIKELDLFAKKYHVDLIGNFQSFGHFKNILKVPGYEYLGENEHTLSPAKEESYKFLENVYKEIVPAYTSKYFHINCDEVGLGEGPSKPMIDSMGRDGVYAYHINRVNKLLKPYQKKIMMWGDIALKNPKIIDRLPKDMIVVSWGYAAMNTMDSDILPIVKSGLDFMVAPGVSCWSRIYPDMNRSVVNIYNYLRDGYKHRAMGFINTTWDDDGSNLFNNNWHGLVWGADCGWNAPVNEPVKESEATRNERLSAFNRSYNRVYFKTEKNITGLLWRISDLRNGPVKNCLTEGSIWSPLLPHDDNIAANDEQDNLNLVKTIDSLLHETEKLKPYFAYRASEFDLLPLALKQARVVASKNLLTIRLKRFIQQEHSNGDTYFRKDLAVLAESVKNLKPQYGKLWALENRNWWLDTVYLLYNSFEQKLDNLKGVCLINASDTLVKGHRELSLRSTYKNLPLYYTLDGTTPNLNSLKYTGPIHATSNVILSARVIDNDKMYEVQKDSFIFHRGIGTLHKLNSAWETVNPAYAARGIYGLLDGRRGSKTNFEDGRWQGYIGTDIDVELDFKEPTLISRITMGFGQLMLYGILFPKQIEVWSSPDGMNYSRVNTLENTIEPNTKQRQTHDFVVPVNTTTRYLKVVAKSVGLLPEWHYAKGFASRMFADEIIVE